MFVNPHSAFVCDIIVRGILPKRHNRLDVVFIAHNLPDFFLLCKNIKISYFLYNKYEI